MSLRKVVLHLTDFEKWGGLGGNRTRKLQHRIQFPLIHHKGGRCFRSLFCEVHLQSREKVGYFLLTNEAADFHIGLCHGGILGLQKLPLVERILRVTNNKHYLHWVHLYYGRCPIFHKRPLLCFVHRLIVLVVLHLESPIRHRAVRTVVRVVGADRPDLLAICVVQIEFGAAGDGGPTTGHATECGNGVFDTIGRVVVVIIPADTDVALRQLVETIPFCADLHLLGDGDIANILETRCGKQIAYLVIAVVEHDPLHEIGGIALGFEHLDCQRDELSTIVRRSEDTDSGAGHRGSGLLLCGEEGFNWL